MSFLSGVITTAIDYYKKYIPPEIKRELFGEETKKAVVTVKAPTINTTDIPTTQTLTVADDTIDHPIPKGEPGKHTVYNTKTNELIGHFSKPLFKKLMHEGRFNTVFGHFYTKDTLPKSTEITIATNPNNDKSSDIFTYTDPHSGVKHFTDTPNNKVAWKLIPKPKKKTEQYAKITGVEPRPKLVATSIIKKPYGFKVTFLDPETGTEEICYCDAAGLQRYDKQNMLSARC
ncbi:MAG: hypothetical protein ABIH39_05535 [Candidatus Margulisiibacteriota bacterium]